MSPTIKRAALSGTARKSACISMTSTIEVSSITSRSQSSGLSSPRLKPPLLGSTSSGRWMVFASMSRLGHSLGRTPCRRAQQEAGAFRGEDTEDRPDDCCFAHTRPTGHDQSLGYEGEPDCGDLAFGKDKPDALLGPR